MGCMLKDPKIAVQELVASVGKELAEECLEKAKVKKSTREKLVGGRYKSAVGFELHLKIDRAIAAAANLKKQTA